MAIPGKRIMALLALLTTTTWCQEEGISPTNGPVVEPSTRVNEASSVTLLPSSPIITKQIESSGNIRATPSIPIMPIDHTVNTSGFLQPGQVDVTSSLQLMEVSFTPHVNYTTLNKKPSINIKPTVSIHTTQTPVMPTVSVNASERTGMANHGSSLNVTLDSVDKSIHVNITAETEVLVSATNTNMDTSSPISESASVQYQSNITPSGAYTQAYINFTQTALFPLAPPSPPPFTVSRSVIPVSTGAPSNETTEGNSTNHVNDANVNVTESEKAEYGYELNTTTSTNYSPSFMVTATLIQVNYDDIFNNATQLENATEAMEVSTVQTTTVPPLKDVLVAITFDGNCSALYVYVSTEIHFKKILKGVLSELLSLQINHINVMKVQCGSVKATVLMNTQTKEKHLADLKESIDKRELFFNVPDGGRYEATNMEEIPLGGGDAKASGSIDEAVTGFQSLSHTDRVIVIATSVIIGSLFIMGAVMCFRECNQRRVSKSFDLGETPAKSEKQTDGFTLKKMNRPSTIYNDDGTVSPFHHEIPNIIPISEVDDYPFYGKYSKTSEVDVHDIKEPKKNDLNDTAGENSPKQTEGNGVKTTSTENLVPGSINESQGVDNPCFIDEPHANEQSEIKKDIDKSS